MIIGNPAVVAIESVIVEAYERLGFRALGSFCLHVGGFRYGVYAPDATMLAGPINVVERCIAERGTHTAPFAEQDAGLIADTYRAVHYSDEAYDKVCDLDEEEEPADYFGLSWTQFRECIHAGQIDEWNPGCDEAFDDGSYILQFDVGDRVRLIAFRCKESKYDHVNPKPPLSDMWFSADDCGHAPATLRDVWLPADEFYTILQQWRDAFYEEWKASPKRPESEEEMSAEEYYAAYQRWCDTFEKKTKASSQETKSAD